jgi:hypothetical protein
MPIPGFDAVKKYTLFTECLHDILQDVYSDQYPYLIFYRNKQIRLQKVLKFSIISYFKIEMWKES